MRTLSGFPFFGLRFGKRGEILEQAEVDAALAHLAAERPTDLLVLSHGWNNDMAEAEALYAGLCAGLRARLDEAPARGAGRAFAVLGVFWPSKRFADRELIPGGAASLGAAAGPAGELREELRSARGAFDAPDGDARLAEAEALVDRLETDPDAQRAYVEIMRSLLRDGPAADEEVEEELPDALFRRDPEEILMDLSADDPVPGRRAGEGGAAGLSGGAAGLGDFVDDLRLGARRLLNLVTYYQMKERARTVGSGGLATVLARVRADAPGTAVHLVGHSFGGRLVTAAADAGGPGEVASLTLLQAAFSHSGFSAARNGLFREVVARGKVAGPILVTHTANDRAVGLAYPLASRIARQAAAALGDADDPFGGLGRNGAVASDALEGTLLPPGGAYRLEPGRLHNLRADACIANHSSVTGPEVAHAILAAVAADRAV